MVQTQSRTPDAMERSTTSLYTRSAYAVSANFFSVGNTYLKSHSGSSRSPPLIKRGTLVQSDSMYTLTIRTSLGWGTGTRAVRGRSALGIRAKSGEENRMTYDVCIDQARHQEFARPCAEIDKIILAIFQATLRDDVADER